MNCFMNIGKHISRFHIRPRKGMRREPVYSDSDDGIARPGWDVPVAGKYLKKLEGFNDCEQLGVWRPSTEQFIVSDPSSACGGRGMNPSPSISLNWGSNNDYGLAERPNDIPLTINYPKPEGVLDRPIAYRPTAGYFQYSNQMTRLFTILRVG